MFAILRNDRYIQRYIGMKHGNAIYIYIYTYRSDIDIKVDFVITEE